jgi:signal transduction histidine kinase
LRDQDISDVDRSGKQQGDSSDGRRRRAHLGGVSARVRILGWCTLLVAVALAASVIATRIVLLRRSAQEIDSDLRHEIDEVAALQHAGRDPQTGARFTDADALLRAALARSAPPTSEELLAISEGRVIARGPEPPRLALEADRARLRAWAATRRLTYGTIHTSAGDVRYVAVPVTLTGASGRSVDVFVVARFVAAEYVEIDRTTRVATTIGGGALLVAMGLAWLLAGRVLAPVRDLASTARGITETDLTRRLEVRGDDELARLARVFNDMLDRLSSAFGSQRQFMDDAGHELRTPITVIRGHLELLGDDPDERAQVRSIIIDELDRMSRMVDDLLLLARARRPDFLHTGEVDVAELTADVRRKAASLGDRSWEHDGLATVTVVGDRQRLTQAWMQLAQNAVQHTGSGDRIGIGSTVHDDEVELWVDDDGPGVAPERTEEIFTGFSRADGDRGNGGHGLGLPIVRAIARAHGGDVAVTTSALGGARLTITLPTRAAAPGADRR